MGVGVVWYGVAWCGVVWCGGGDLRSGCVPAGVRFVAFGRMLIVPKPVP
ncbi:MAG: hypothetical protein ACXQTZ_04915 [Candidatus Alkanophagales archaeon]